MTSKDERIGWIDGLRALAIVGVIAVHCKGIATPDATSKLNILQYGQYGVQLFFLISTITTFETLSRSKSDFEWISKRLLRIAPLYYIGIALYAIMRAVEQKFGGNQHIESPSAIDIISNVLFLNGWVPSANNNVVPGGWSIAVEITYYAIAVSALHAAEKRSKAAAVATAATLGATILAINFLVTGWHVKNNSFFYYWPPAQIPAFLFGYVIFRLAPLQKAPIGIYFLSACFALGGLWACDRMGATAPTVNFLVPTAMTCAFWAIVIGIGQHRNALSAGWLTYIGRISYSMYIFHFAVVDTTRFALNRAGVHVDSWPEIIATIIFTTAASVAVATMSYSFIEKPMDKASKKIIRSIFRTQAPDAA